MFSVECDPSYLLFCFAWDFLRFSDGNGVFLMCNWTILTNSDLGFA